ncbi:MAG: peptidylprolyl isomerase, partial [Selenomonadaceae bacterium]|nr:peptidylprolyl isomerase [Selenomonadaceae bacterium]
MKKIVLCLMLVLGVISAGCFAAGVTGKGEDKVANPIAVIETNKGTIEIELFADKAPKTVENFVALAK